MVHIKAKSRKPARFEAYSFSLADSSVAPAEPQSCLASRIPSPRPRCIRLPELHRNAWLACPPFANPREAREWRAGQDRKSTRLNSSHTVISYAVFCLKKKKKKPTNGITNRKRKIHQDL